MHTRKGLGGFFFPNPTAQRRLTDASETRADESDDGIKKRRMREIYLWMWQVKKSGFQM